MKHSLVACVVAVALIVGAKPGMAQDPQTEAGARAAVLRQLREEFRDRGVYELRVNGLGQIGQALDSLKECGQGEVSTPSGCHGTQKVVALTGARLIGTDSAIVTPAKFADTPGPDRSFNITAVALHYERGRWRSTGIIEPSIGKHKDRP